MVVYKSWPLIERASFANTEPFMMYIYLLVSGVVLNYFAGASEDRSKDLASENISKSFGPLVKNNVASHHNITYIEKAENMLRTPNINKYYEEHKKKKKPKKSPKRTIQKIIKKNRAKMRRVYFSQKPSQTTQAPKIDYEKLYGQEEKQWNEMTTTQASQKKKSRKFSPKLAGYHMPFQKLQSMKEKRYKRGGLSRELYILKDLDEMEFLSKEDGDDVVKAHVKDFW